MVKKLTHGGLREGAGRKPRPNQKSKGIWCGQISQEDRDFIIQHLTPDERFQVLMVAANNACSGLLVGSGEKPAKVMKPKTIKPAVSR